MLALTVYTWPYLVGLFVALFGLVFLVTGFLIGARVTILVAGAAVLVTGFTFMAFGVTGDELRGDVGSSISNAPGP
jgi:hypothetical protein